MSIRETKSSLFEVYCPSCSVTFPVGQKHCIHCGGRLSKERLQPGEFAIPFEGADEMDELEAVGGRRSPFSPLALIWLLLFVGGTIYRSCTSG
jgi:hypothetical protein